MSFINLESLNTASRVTVLELIRLLFRGVPEATVVDRRYVEVLRYAGDPGRDAVD